MKDMIKNFTKRRALNGFILAESALILAGALALFVPLVLPQRHYGPDETCISTQKQLSIAIMMYVQENDETMPGENLWRELCMSGRILKCPADKNSVDSSYAYNAYAAGVYLGDFEYPCKTVTLADSDQTNDLLYSAEDVVFRHRGDLAVIAFLDGHVLLMDEYDIDEVDTNGVKQVMFEL